MAEKKKRRRRSLDGVDETQERFTMSTESSSAQRRRSYPQADLSGEVLKRISKIPTANRNAFPSNRNYSCKAVWLVHYVQLNRRYQTLLLCFDLMIPGLFT